MTTVMSAKMAERIFQYLMTKPWAEVNPLIVDWLKEKRMEDSDGDRCLDDKAGSSEPDPESS